MDGMQGEQVFEGRSWSDDQTRQHLQVLVEGVATLAGFEQSAVSLHRDGVYELVAAAGLADRFVGRRLPTDVVEGELATADQWGAWRFVPADRASEEVLEYSSIPDAPDLDEADAWHPLNLLVAPLFDDDGRIRGLLSVDSPRNGRLPGPEQLEVLTQYADVARTLVLLALEREELSERVRIASEAREIVRQALGEPTLQLVLDACRSKVVECFDAVGMWVTAFGDSGEGSTAWFAEGAESTPLFSEVDDMMRRLARRYWSDQYVGPFSRANATHPGLPPDDAERLLAFLDRIGIGSVLFVPLGVGPECLGFLVLTRVSDARQWWTDVECDAALDIGRDLGRAVANARQIERERAVADHLRKLDGYRTEMVNTLGHELRTPLFSMTANLEMLDVDALGPDDRRSVAAANRGAARMQTVIEDLLAMAQVGDPLHEFVPQEVDVRQVLLDVAEECRPASAEKDQACVLDVPDDPVLVAGRPDELHRMLANLASNAIKYSDHGGSITVRLSRDDDVAISFTDTGIGISASDQEQLFREFFRSTNPDALARPGTGLGLAIVDRVVRRHSGRVELTSELGQGTTVTVVLPALGPEQVGDDAERAS